MTDLETLQAQAAKMGFTLVQFAAQTGQLALVPQGMITPEAMTALTNAGVSALHLAAKHQQLGSVPKTLLANIPLILNKTRTEGNTVAHTAAEHGVLNYLPTNVISAVAGTKNNKGVTVAHYSAISGTLNHLSTKDVSRLALETDEAGVTPLHHAAANGNLIQIPPEHKTLPNMLRPIGYRGYNCFHLAAMHGKLSDIPPEFLDDPQAMLSRDKQGESPIELAYRYGNENQIPLKTREHLLKLDNKSPAVLEFAAELRNANYNTSVTQHSPTKGVLNIEGKNVPYEVRKEGTGESALVLDTSKLPPDVARRVSKEVDCAWMQSQPQAAYYAAARSLRSFADKQGWNECSVKKDPSGKACITNPNGQTFYATLSPNKDKCVLSSDSPEIDQRLRLDWDLHQADHAAHLLPNTSKIETEERTIRLAQNLQATNPDIKVVGYDITRQNGKNMIMLDLEKDGQRYRTPVEEPFPKGQDKISKAVAQAWKVTNPNAGKENLSLLQRILKAVGITPTKQVISSSPDQGAMALASWKEGDAAIHYDNAERKLLVKSSVPEQERAISSKFKSFTGHSPERDPHKESSRGLDRN